jgi:hypothetical protein
MERFKMKLNCNVLYTRRFFPSMEKCKLVYVKCNFCPVTMTFGQTPDDIYLQRIARQHRHTIQKICKMNKSDVKQRHIQSNRQDPERKKNASSETAQLEEIKNNIKQLKPDKDEFKVLKTLLKSEKFKTYEFYEDTKRDTYPDIVVAVSPAMMENAHAVGDSLGF